MYVDLFVLKRITVSVFALFLFIEYTILFARVGALLLKSHASIYWRSAQVLQYILARVLQHILFTLYSLVVRFMRKANCKGRTVCCLCVCVGYTSVKSTSIKRIGIKL